MERTPPPPQASLIGPALAFIAGVSDASTFVGANGIFSAHVTGNFVVLAADLARGAQRDEWLKLATFPLFVGAVLGSTWVHRRFGVSPSVRAARFLLASKAALILAAALSGTVLVAWAPGPARVAVVAFLVLAMGIQNAIHRLTPSLGPMTTVMTGNVTGWLVDAMAELEPEPARKHRLLGLTILSFAAGCLVGAVGVASLGFGILVLPAVIAILIRARMAPE